MVWQKLTKYNEAVNFTNISNAFQTDHLQDITFADISRYHRFILTGICVIVMLGILFTNVTVIICLFKTNQTRNLSFRTILHLSFSDVLVALIALPTFIFGTVNKTNYHPLVIASPFFNSLFTHISLYILGLIGVDRFIRIKYYTKHREILTPFRVFVTRILIWGLALLNTILNVLCLLYKIPAFRLFICVVWYFLYHSGSDSPDQNNIVKKTSNGITWKFDRSKNQDISYKNPRFNISCYHLI